MNKHNIFFAVIYIFFPFLLSAQSYIGDQKLYYGAAYYPESWSPEQVDEDIKWMKSANINVVRMAEFAWSTMEPREGEYQFEWLHITIEKLHEHGIDVILGTPTATPPIWLWEKHPEIGIVDESGRRKFHGERKSYSYASDIYLEYVRKIVSKMADEFGQKPGVIGWQIDNELSPHKDYSNETSFKWHKWLREKYGTIDHLNDRWATELWSQTYHRFDQIPMPVSWQWHHNSLRWDFAQFNSDLVEAFMQVQVAVIKQHSDLPITHDTMPGQDTDYEGLMQHADFMAVNNYHSFEVYDRVVSNYDRMRGYKKGYHWLFETAPNYSGGGKDGKTWFIHQPVGSVRAAIWMNFALGGQGSLYWLFRQHRAGQEMVHGHVISAWGKPAANFDMLKQIGKELRTSSDFLINNYVTPPEIAIVYNHEADMGLNIEQYVNNIDYYNDWTYRFYVPLHDQYLHRDVIGFSTRELEQYKIIILPMAPYIPQSFRSRLNGWVENGGILIFGPMSGYRTDAWTFFTEHAYGDICDWSDIEVQSRIPVGVSRREAETPFYLDWQDELNLNQDIEVRLWSDALSSSTGKVLARYQNGVHSDLPAVIESEVGKGKVIMLGTDPGRINMGKLYLHYAEEVGVKPVAKGDTGLLVVPRGKDGNAGYVIDNITGEALNIEIPLSNSEDILSGKKHQNRITVAPYDVKVLKPN